MNWHAYKFALEGFCRIASVPEMIFKPTYAKMQWVVMYCCGKMYFPVASILQKLGNHPNFIP